jgi:hypothetical protein
MALNIADEKISADEWLPDRADAPVKICVVALCRSSSESRD